MIFEVVNDRGLGLNPYEILKGKLIGRMYGDQKEKANAIWTNLQERYFKVELRNTTEKSINLDLFFQTFFRAKFADSENDYEKFEGEYHYKVRAYFGEFEDDKLLFDLISGELKIFAESLDSKVHAGLQSLRNMRRMEAKRRNMRAVRLRFSQSLANLRQRLSQAIDRSTIQRLGTVTKPFA